jgi:hypothetical protein
MKWKSSPLKRCPSLLISKNGDQLNVLDSVGEEAIPDDSAMHTARAGGGSGHSHEIEGNTDDVQGLYSLMYQQQWQMEEAHSESNERIFGLMIEINPIGTNIRRIARHHFACWIGVEGIVDVAMLQEHAPTSLSQRPTDLFVIWKEYEFGIGGHKPVKEFMTRERGASQAGFSHHKVFWDAVLDLIRLVYIQETATDKICLTYECDTSITDILTLIRADKAYGGGARRAMGAL